MKSSYTKTLHSLIFSKNPRVMLLGGVMAIAFVAQPWLRVLDTPDLTLYRRIELMLEPVINIVITVAAAALDPRALEEDSEN